MKLSQTLLNAIFIGMTAGAVTSCGLTDTVSDFNEEGEEMGVIVCGDVVGDGGTKNVTYDSCPACGMG